MAFTNIKPGGYAFGEILPSADMTNVTSDLSNAIDKRSGALEITSQTVTMRQPLVLIPHNVVTPAFTYMQLVDSSWVLNTTSPATYDKYETPISNIPGNGTLAVVRVGLKHTTTPTAGQGVVVEFSSKKDDATGDSDGQTSTAASSNVFQDVTITLATPAPTSGVSRNTGLSVVLDIENYDDDTGSTVLIYYVECDFTVTKLLDV